MSVKPVLLALGLIAATGALAQDPGQPLKSELRENVEVHYVILDALVTDDRGRIVPDLTIDDFKLFLDLKPHEIDAVDVFCPAGPAADPRAVRVGEQREGTVAPDVFRRIVIAVDYRNLEQTDRVDAAERLAAMVRDSRPDHEELMVVALTDRIRVEQPFTTDRGEVLGALTRMKNDLSLWDAQPNVTYRPGGPVLRPHVHELALFEGLAGLVRWLGTYDGAKAIVFVSELPSKIPDAPFVRPLLDTPPAFDYDPQFEAVATSAAEARVAIYPVHARGLVPKASSERLARLAVETGGRFTRNTNDLSLAYARAQRDLACRYAVAFYDRSPDPEQLHRVNLQARGGLRVHHPTLYRFGALDDAVENIDAEAFTASADRRAARIGARAFPLEPLEGGQWRVALALRFPVSVPPEGDNVVRFGAKLDHDALQTVHTLSNSVTIPAAGEGGELKVTTVDPLDLEPGRYDLSMRVDDARVGRPRTAVGQVDVPALPRRGVVVAGPLLLRPAPGDLLVHWGEDVAPLLETTANDALAPVFPGESVASGGLVAVTRVCRLLPKPKGSPVSLEVRRRLVAADGTAAATWPAARFELAPARGAACRSLIDALPAALGPGAYRLEVSSRVDAKAASVRELAFSVQ